MHSNGSRSPANRRRLREGRRGLSLVEIVFAVALLTIFFTGMFGTLTMTQRAEVSTREHQMASLAAHRKLDELLSISDFSRLPSSSVGAEDIEGEAFDVTYVSGVDLDGDLAYTGTGERAPVFLPPAEASFWPLNPGGASGRAGHVQVWRHENYDFDGDGVDDLDGGDYDLDGSVDLAEIRVIVAWRSADGTNRKLEVSSWRGR